MILEIKDSGERREFSTGAMRDIQEGKGRMDLLPWEAIMEVSKHCEAGAKKYGEHNVDKGIPHIPFVIRRQDTLRSIYPDGMTSHTSWQPHGIYCGLSRWR